MMNELTGGIKADIFIPASDWRDPDQDRREAELLWPRTWQMACRESDLKAKGDYVVYDILDESILVIKTGDGADDIHAMYNVCQHRGRKLTERAKGKFGNDIACRFHGWRFGLTGELKHVPFEGDWDGCAAFNKAELTIPAVQVARWGGWVWINQDADAIPLAEWLKDVSPVLEPFDLAAMRPLWWKTIIADVNWKIIVEAFCEGYHSGETHISGINYREAPMPTQVVGEHAMFYNAPAPFTEYKTEKGGWATPKTFVEHFWANQKHLYSTLGAITLEPGMKATERLLDLPDDTPPEQTLALFFDYQLDELAKRGVTLPETMNMEKWFAAGTDWHIFPNSIFLPSLDGALWYRIRPGKHHDQAVFDIWSFGRFAPGAEPVVEQEIYHGFEAFKGNCEFLEEDFLNMEAVNQGVKSRGFKGAVTNPVQEGTVAHFHRKLREWCA
ncbi:aromatic ring-hydroxylating oxygenase subunit alpha [Sphingomonas montanisoli]|uniref:Aromatic ring-hydroxylating dioxygenase subunit alpha n=1 Tax=Sphingomonas montanisoli TaxID=2606412 RepID=A0A5D9CAS9_9SPHN|nr:aromatic ring-hydroxylating dioxygenase subunit alpha [Sphingomonas montanisoli]TZG28904.1 aromatic ring-hydroxylating dioxygenase subunit alpha [Sphingomonas montanisoli]